MPRILPRPLKHKHQQQTCLLIFLVGACVASIASLRRRFLAPIQILSFPSVSFQEKHNYNNITETSLDLEMIKKRDVSSLLLSSPNNHSFEEEQASTIALDSTDHENHPLTTSLELISKNAAIANRTENSSTTTATTDNNEQDSSCFSLNSKAWLQGPRHGNIQVQKDWLHLTMTPPHQLLFPSPHDDSSSSQSFHQLLNQTLCHEHGRFRRGLDHAANYVWHEVTNHHFEENATFTVIEEETYRWEFRLLYLAIHSWLHQPAYDEYQQRRRTSNCGHHQDQSHNNTPKISSPDDTASSNTRRIGNFDYECPNAKFVVIVLTNKGMGATIRNGFIPSMYVALATRRIPVFVSSRQLLVWRLHQTRTGKAEQNANHFDKSFPLASCPRHDLQCVFLPLSPCVLTLQDIVTGTALNDAENRQLKQTGTYRNESHAQERVLIHHTNFIPLRPKASIHDKIRLWAYETIHGMIMRNSTSDEHTDETKTKNKTRAGQVRSGFRNVLTMAMDSYKEPYWKDADDEFRKVYRNLGGALFYLLRPNAKARLEMTKQFQGTMMNTMKSTHHLETNTSRAAQRQYFGLPVRASDKCDKESTCLTFDRYMEMMVELWGQHGLPGHRGTILLTSEDSRVLPKRLAFSQNTSFPFDFWVNHRDAQPDSGAPQSFRENADAIMISSLTAIQIQLQASFIVANCCSNFHSLLQSLVGEGCGRDPNVVFLCLDKSENPKYRICCAWSSDSACDQIKQEHFATVNHARQELGKPVMKFDHTAN